MSTSLITHFLRFIFLASLIALSLGTNYLYAAWTAAPAGTAPDCPAGYAGCDPPLNTSSVNQVKPAVLDLGAGTATTSLALILRGRAYTEGWLKVGSAGAALQPIDLSGAGANTGIRFPDNTVQTTAATPNTLSFNRYLHVQGRIPSAIPSEDAAVEEVLNTGWQARSLTTDITNTIAGASRSGNMITLPAGTYYVEASAFAWSTNLTQSTFYNVNTGTHTLLGLVSKPNGGGQDRSGNDSSLSGVFTISSAAQFQLRTFASEGGSCFTAVTGVEGVCVDVRVWKLN